jgi:glycosyltransferase involved in cell wall biosynthesis
MHVQEKRLNILFLSSWFPHKGAPTLGNFVHRHAQAISRKHNVFVLFLAPDQSKNSTKHSIEHRNFEGIDTTTVYFNKSGLSISTRIKAFNIGLNQLLIERKIEFDIIHQNVIWPEGWQGVFAKRKLKIPMIISEHWTGYHQAERGKQPLKVKVLSNLVASSAEFIAPVSDDLGNAMRRFGLRSEYITVPNVVDTDIFILKKKESKPLRFLHVSSLYEDQKNITGILRAWKSASDEFSDIHLTIGGDGPWEEVRKHARDLNINEGSIAFFGEKPWEEIAQLMQESHVLLLFSNYENLPCVIVEAMASGMHILSTKVGGISEHISSDIGILIEKGNETELIAAIRKFHNEYPFSNEEHLRKIAEQKFSMESVAAQFDAIYQKAISKFKGE